MKMETRHFVSPAPEGVVVNQLAVWLLKLKRPTRPKGTLDGGS
jgi:hypothetical protein